MEFDGKLAYWPKIQRFLKGFLTLTQPFYHILLLLLLMLLLLLHYPLCCCNTANFPTVGLIQDYLILFYFVLNYCTYRHFVYFDADLFYY